MTNRILLNGKCVATSKNLRGLVDYARKKSPVARVTIYPHAKDHPNAGGAVSVVVFTNGATSRDDWGSATVCAQWFANRKAKAKGWHSADVQTFTTEGEGNE